MSCVVKIVQLIISGCPHTHIQHQSLRRSFGSINPEGRHAAHDGTDEVDIENRKAVDDVKDHSNGQEGQTPNARHLGGVEAKMVADGEDRRSRFPGTRNLASRHPRIRGGR